MSKIFDFVKPGVISGDDVQKVFAVAKENKFALPAVNVVNTDTVNGVLEAAAKVKAPVIVQFYLTRRMPLSLLVKVLSLKAKVHKSLVLLLVLNTYMLLLKLTVFQLFFTLTMLRKNYFLGLTDY